MTKNTFSIDDDIITIYRDDWDQVALATYRQDYYTELSGHTWGIKNGYPFNSKLGGGLHRYMMAKWYGNDELKRFTDMGYVVDHMNNNHMDCRITNLEFLKKPYNTAKGQSFDVDSEEMRRRIAVSIYKDFSTGFYQIVVACNDNIGQINSDGIIQWINSIKFLYTCDYSVVINDAENILRIYDTEGRIPLHQNYAQEVRINYAPDIECTEEEKKQPFFSRDGHVYMVNGNGQAFIHSVGYDKGWKLHKQEEK